MNTNINQIIEKNKTKPEMTIIKESTYTYTPKDLKFKTTAIFHIKKGKIEDIDLNIESRLKFKLRNIKQLLPFHDDIYFDEEYNDFLNYVLNDFYLEHKVRLLIKTVGLNGISFYKHKDIKREDQVFVVKPKKGVKL